MKVSRLFRDTTENSFSPQPLQVTIMAGGRRLSPRQCQQGSILAKAGCSISAIASCFHCTRSVVERWVQEGQKLRPNWRDAPGRGRLPTINSALRTKAKRMARKGQCARRIAVGLSQQHGVEVSEDQVRAALKGGREVLFGRSKVQSHNGPPPEHIVLRAEAAKPKAGKVAGVFVPIHV